MKVCSKCKTEKPLERFSKNKAKPDGIHTSCKDCHSAYLKIHYAANKAYYLAKARKRNLLYADDNRRIVQEYLLTHPCVDCGESDPVVLEFDHVRGEKTESVSVLAYRLRATQKRLLAEIDKCEIRCANCHRRKTAKQLGWFVWLEGGTIASETTGSGNPGQGVLHNGLSA